MLCKPTSHKTDRFQSTQRDAPPFCSVRTVCLLCVLPCLACVNSLRTSPPHPLLLYYTNTPWPRSSHLVRSVALGIHITAVIEVNKGETSQQQQQRSL